MGLLLWRKCLARLFRRRCGATAASQLRVHDRLGCPGNEVAAAQKELPDSNDALVVRTDFTDEAAWSRLRREMEAPVGEFRAHLSFFSNPDLDGISIADLTVLGQQGPYRSFLFVVDRVTIADVEHPILVLDLLDEPGRIFRVIPREMWSVQNNLSIANMDFLDFAESVDSDGVFRGFGDG